LAYEGLDLQITQQRNC